MSQKDGRTRQERITHLSRVALLAAVALVLSYVETLIPLPVSLPGVKLGLANVAVVVALFWLDARSAAEIALVKVLASGLLFGSPTMLVYSLGGTVLAFAGMWLMSLIPGIGLVPVSMVSAILHNVGQLVVAALMLNSPAVFASLPALAAAACVPGALTGAVAEGALSALDAWDNDESSVGASSGEVVAEGRPFIDVSGIVLVPGEHVAFIGANGSGKSTAALELAGLLGDEAASTLSAGPDERRVGLAFQDPDSQIVASVVENDVAFGPENRGMTHAEMSRAVAQALDQADAASLADREIETLSGGERQKVAVAGLLALKPGVVIFDESTSMLDPESRRSHERLVRSLCAQGLSVISITQHMDEAFVADRVYLFKDLCVVGNFLPEELVDQGELLSECGLELPACARLSSTLSEAGIDVVRTNDEDELEEALWRWCANTSA